MIVNIREQIERVIIAVVMVAMASWFSACTFDTSGVPSEPDAPYVYDQMEASPAVDMTDNDRWVAYFDFRDRLLAYHGRACFEAKNSVGKHHIGYRVRDRINLIDKFDDEATVFMNGWDVEYKGRNDHKVLGLGVTIFDIKRVGDELHWQAWAALSDINGDDAIKICYYYTVVMWEHQSEGIEAFPIHSDNAGSLLFIGSEEGNVPARRHIPGIIEDSQSAPRAVLPQGFGAMHTDRDDHNLLQLAFNYGDTITFFNPGVPSGADGPGTISWIGDSIFQDNQFRKIRTFNMVSGLSGRSVTVEQPQFDFNPRRPVSCLGNRVVDFEKEVTVEVPFEHAIPMLTGWRLDNACDDTHLKRMGVWITDFDFYRNRDTNMGVLTYRVAGTLYDDGKSQGLSSAHYPRYKVSILGFNSLDSATLLTGEQEQTDPTSGRIRNRR